MTPCNEYANTRFLGLNSRNIIWSNKNNGFGTVGLENDHQHSCRFDFQGRIVPKIEHACLSTWSESRFLHPNLPKVGTRIYTEDHEISGPPPQCSTERPRGSKDLSKTSSGDKFHIAKLPINRKAAVTRIYIYMYIYICILVCLLCLFRVRFSYAMCAVFI